MNKSYNQIDYLGDIKASYRLIERIKSYYVSRGIPLWKAKFWIERDIDQWGYRINSIRSNIKYNMVTRTMEIHE